MKTLFLTTHWRRTSALARGLALSALAVSAWTLSAFGATAQAHELHGTVTWQQPGVVLSVSAPPHRATVYPPGVVVVQAAPWVQPVHAQAWGHGPRWDERRERRGHARHHRYDRHDRDNHHDRRDRDDHRDHDRSDRGNDERRDNDRR